MRVSWLGVGVILGVPAFALLTVSNLINQAGTIDPFVYTGYIHHYHELLARFGRTYYSTRIAFIHPARASIALFGDSAGYVVLRFVALAASLASVWSIARRYYGEQVAAFSVVFVGLQPILLRALLWDHIDGFAAMYLLAGMACLIGISESPGAWAAAGGLLALAVNCQPFTLGVAVGFLPAWLLLQPADTPWRRRAAGIGVVAAAFVAMSILLAVALHLELPVGAWLYDSTSLGTSRTLLLSGAVAVWYAPWSALLLSYRFFILTPLFFGVVLVFVLRPGEGRALAQPRLCASALVYTAAVAAYYIGMHIVFRGGVLATSYVLTYTFPAMTLCIVCAAGESAKRAGSRAPMMMGTAAGLYTLLWLLGPILHGAMAIVPFWLIGGMAALVVIVLAAGIRAPAASFAAVLAACIASPVVAYRLDGESYRTLHHRSWAAVEWATYRSALHLMDVVESLPNPGLRIAFWYPIDVKAKGDKYLSFKSVQSVYLWAYTRLTGTKDVRTLDDDARKRLNDAARVVLLGYDQTDIDEERRRLDEAGAVMRPIAEDRFEDSGLSYRTTVLERGSHARQAPAETETVIAPVALASIQPLNGGGAVLAGGALTVTTPPAQWAYAAGAHVPPPRTARGPATLRIRLRVLDGRLGVGITSVGDASGMIGEAAAEKTNAPVQLSVDVPDVAAIDSLVVRSWAPNGIRTRAEILSVELLLAAERGADDDVDSVPLAALRASNGGRLTREKDGSMTLVTPPSQWAYAAAAEIRMPKDARGGARVRVRLQVESGQLGVAATPVGDVSRFINEQSMVPTTAPTALSIDVPDRSKLGAVVFRSWVPSGTATRARILAIDIVHPRQ